MSDELFTETTSENNTEGSGAAAEELFSVGERKYNVDTAKVKIENADKHIKTLEQENAELRDKANKAVTMEQVLEAIKQPTDTSRETPALSQEDLASIVDERLSAKDAATRAEENRMKAGKVMVEKFGEKAKEVMLKTGEGLGLGPETLQSIAEKSPTAFLKLFETAETASASTSSAGTINTEAIGVSDPNQGTYAWYEKMRKENPKLYRSTKVQNQMFKDAERMGQEKFMGD